ncbi:MAG: sporulation integral membrane protein YlbJ [Syntrophomonadaceae bacterium]|nr:sporulation integral membrane protein YlbJ [Syntrophomonadaceae bacterium]MDD3898540.1 sporulation integral membrane protein YlbJ [Syntrophomonadaceae bacterium]
MGNYSRVFFLIIILILTTFMIINPQETVTAAGMGCKLWFTILLPALLPFFIVAELMVSLGFVNFLGVILEPVMRPIFRLPGCSSLVVVMGFTSGFPIGAVLSRRLYDEKSLTADEAERLVSFTNNSSPLFILGAVGVGMFGSPLAGYVLAFSHYLSNMLVGLIWRFRGSPPITRSLRREQSLLQEACRAFLQHQNPRGVGALLGDAIKNSLNNILAIAGFVIIFSVLTRMLAVWGIMDGIAMMLSYLFKALCLPYPVAYGLGMGIFEITLGTRTVVLASQADFLYKLLAASAILAFSGFSIIAQVMSIMAGTAVRLSFYMLSRLIQLILSLAITLLTYKMIVPHLAVSSFTIPYYKALYSFDAWNLSLFCLLIGLVLITLMMFLSLWWQD